MERVNKRRFFARSEWHAPGSNQNFTRNHLGALFMVRSESVGVGQREEAHLCYGRDDDEAPAICRKY